MTAAMFCLCFGVVKPHNACYNKLVCFYAKSRLTVVSREAKEEVPCDGHSPSIVLKTQKYILASDMCHLAESIVDVRTVQSLSTNAREYFTRTNLAKIKNAITYEPLMLALHYSR